MFLFYTYLSNSGAVLDVMGVYNSRYHLVTGWLMLHPGFSYPFACSIRKV